MERSEQIAERRRLQPAGQLHPLVVSRTMRAIQETGRNPASRPG
jgi:hypothetical protein